MNYSLSVAKRNNSYKPLEMAALRILAKIRKSKWKQCILSQLKNVSL